jgi:hypothetical protein
MLGTSMPETTVHEYTKTIFFEDKIRAAKKFNAPPPAGDVIPSKDSY